MTNEDFLTALNLVVTVALAVWAVYQTRLTHGLERELHRLNIELDQNIQRLYRARDTLIELQKAVALSKVAIDPAAGRSVPLETLSAVYADTLASTTELMGLTRVIGDKLLSEQVTKLLSVNSVAELRKGGTNVDDFVYNTALIYARIYELIAETTKGYKRN